MHHSQSEPLFFINVPKSGGLSLYDAIRSIYGRRKVLSSHDGNYRHAFETWKGTKRAEKAVVYYGHFPYGVHQLISSRPQYLTMLRDPVDRVVSLYYYLKQSPQHPAHKRAKYNTLVDFVLRYPGFCNQQSRFMAGFSSQGDSSPTPADDAIANSHNFLAVGITSEFDASLLLYSHCLRWGRVPFYTRTNISKRVPLSSLTSVERKSIESANSDDMRVYSFYKERFYRDLSAIPSFTEKLDSYISANTQASLVQRASLWARGLHSQVRALF